MRSFREINIALYLEETHVLDVKSVSCLRWSWKRNRQLFNQSSWSWNDAGQKKSHFQAGRASIMKMGRRLESCLILQIRGKLPIEEEFANCQAEKFAFKMMLWISSAATAIRNKREGSVAIWPLVIMVQLIWGERSKNQDCCLNCEPGFSGFQRERERFWWWGAWHDICFGCTDSFCNIQTIVLTTCTWRYRRKILILWN